MRVNALEKGTLLAFGLLSTLLAYAPHTQAQESGKAAAVVAPAPQFSNDPKAFEALVHQLQSQVQELSNQLQDMKAQQQRAEAKSLELRRELDLAKSQLVSLSTPPANSSASGQTPSSATTSEERLDRLEENQQLTDSKVREQSQTKVESSSKYRVRLSGIALVNMYSTRGSVDNQDFPHLALEPEALSSGGTFGGSLRQSQIGLETFGPVIAGAHTSANIRFDFAGGFPGTPNGVTTGVVRFRTGTVRFDWSKTSLVAGQDALFIAPLTPTSLASLAIPALSYAGNLWSWVPQIRVEHRFALSDSSTVLWQGGILDSLSGDPPESEYNRSATPGESSGQPAYAMRMAFTRRVFGQNLTAGAGGYYGRQNWGIGRNVDSWAGTLDLLLPVGKFVEFSGQYYRGRAVGGLGGGIGQSVLWNGILTDPATNVHGIESMGGWSQLKVKATTKFEINGAFGEDSPFSSQLRMFSENPSYYDALMSKNQSGFVNFIYRPRSDTVFSVEYRRLKTFKLDEEAETANHINLSMGYIF